MKNKFHSDIFAHRRDTDWSNSFSKTNSEQKEKRQNQINKKSGAAEFIRLRHFTRSISGKLRNKSFYNTLILCLTMLADVAVSWIDWIKKPKFMHISKVPWANIWRKIMTRVLRISCDVLLIFGCLVWHMRVCSFFYCFFARLSISL